MIEVIEYTNSPIKLPVQKDAALLPGQIVRLIRTSSDVYCALSNCIAPFGIVTAPVDDFGFVSVLATGAAIIITDVFEETFEYHSGALIYSNNDGLITTRKIDDNAVLVAYVIAGNTNGRNYIEINWI